MGGETCPMPGMSDASEEAQVVRLLAGQRVVIVGLSDDPIRASNRIGQYLIGAGKTVLPVNPTRQTVLGLSCYKTLADVPGSIDVVNVFRRAEFCPDVVRDAIKAGAKGVWLQAGIFSKESREIARKAGINYVEGKCIMVEHRYRLR